MKNKEEVFTPIKYVVWNKNDNSFILVCPNCDKELVKIIQLENINQKSTWQAICPNCNIKSFIKKTDYKCKIIETEEFSFIDIDYDDINNVSLIKLKEKK